MEILNIQIEVAEDIDNDEMENLMATVREKLILELFREGKITTSMAAKHLGLGGVYDFLDYLADKHIPYLAEKVDLKAIERVERQLEVKNK